MQFETDLLIIGAGPVGLFTVFAAGMLGIKNCHLMDSLEFAGGQCSALYPEKFIYDIPGIPKILAKDLVRDLIEQGKRFNPVFHFGQITEKLEKSDDYFVITTSKNTQIKAKGIIIAGGSGMFAPNKPPLENLVEFEEKSVFYAINSYERFKNKTVVIAGGGDSAIDFALILGAEIAKKVILVHRREKFRCAPESLNQIHELREKGKIEFITPYQLHSISGENGILQSVQVSNISAQEIKKIEADFLLPFFGLKMNLGPLQNWDLELWKNKQIKVSLPSCTTNIPKIYVIGDMAGFEGKIKLISTGFAEATYACHDFFKKLYPDTPLHTQHSSDMFKD